MAKPTPMDHFGFLALGTLILLGTFSIIYFLVQLTLLLGPFVLVIPTFGIIAYAIGRSIFEWP